jgi:hypothetical protein
MLDSKTVDIRMETVEMQYFGNMKLDNMRMKDKTINLLFGKNGIKMGQIFKPIKCLRLQQTHGSKIT